MKHKLFPLFLLAMLASPGLAVSQNDEALLRDLAEENKKSVEALVLYPSETRLAILEATKYPEVLIKMQGMRDKTSAAFRTLIEDFPRSTQAVFYNLSRYPELVESLVQHKNNSAELRKSLEVLPAEQRDEAYGVVSRQMATLIQINDLNLTARSAFDRLVLHYSASARQAFEHLLGLPEVIDLLNEDLRFTIMVGETYRENPAMVIQKMDSLNLAVARAHATELQDWKNTLENDPVAKAELQSAAKEYAAEYGYQEEWDDLYADDNYYYEDDDPVVRRRYYNPYPYWYGYPWWEPYPRWRPYPWWWDWGCHFYPHRVIIVYLPSYHFMHWYFWHPHHHYRYNRLSTHFVNHYYGHRRSGTTITMGVRDWQNRNRTIISDAFLADKGRLPEKLKEYGRFETSRQEYNAKNPKKTVSAEEFLDKNARKYPEIQSSRTAAQSEIQRHNSLRRDQRSDWAPEKAITRPEPAPEPKPQPQRPTRTEPTAPTQRPARPSTRQPQTQPDEAKDYHRQKWEEIKPAPKSTPEIRRSTPPPAPKRNAPTPTKTTPQRGGRGN